MATTPRDRYRAGARTTPLAPRTRADTNAGLGTIDDVRLASRHRRVRFRFRLSAAQGLRLRNAWKERYGPRCETRGQSPKRSRGRSEPEACKRSRCAAEPTLSTAASYGRASRRLLST